jgi:hypothetical protein
MVKVNEFRVLYPVDVDCASQQFTFDTVRSWAFFGIMVSTFLLDPKVSTTN